MLTALDAGPVPFAIIISVCTLNHGLELALTMALDFVGSARWPDVAHHIRVVLLVRRKLRNVQQNLRLTGRGHRR